MWNFNKKIPLRDSGKDRWDDVNVAFTDRIQAAITCPIWGIALQLMGKKTSSIY